MFPHALSHLTTEASANSVCRVEKQLGLAAAAVEVSLTQCDTSMATDTATVLASVPSKPLLAGVLNSGGITRDAVFTAQKAADIRSVFAPKLSSMSAMQQGIVGQPVRQHLLFSSAASLLGAPGQSSYAAANAALEGWMESEAANGTVGSAIQWGVWSAGMMGSPAVGFVRENTVWLSPRTE